jgi:hypothetical protein
MGIIHPALYNNSSSQTTGIIVYATPPSPFTAAYPSWFAGEGDFFTALSLH